MLLSIYFDLFGPTIRVTATTAFQSCDETLKRQLQLIIMIPPTWRQVRRITTAIFVVVYAYWKGEVSYDEACRSASMALALLEFQRSRWGSSLQEAITSVRGLVASSGLLIRPFVQQLVPDATDAYLTNICGRVNRDDNHEQDESLINPQENMFADDGDRPHNEPTPWWLEQGIAGNIFDTVPMYDFSSFGCWEDSIDNT